MQQQIPNYNPDFKKYVEVFLAARDLPNLEIFSKSDPICEVYYTIEGEAEQYFGKTEVILDNLNPNWETSFEFEYFDDLTQSLRFVISDYDSETKKTELGYFIVSLQQLMKAPTQFIKAPLRSEKEIKGAIMLKGLAYEASNHYVSLKFSGKSLINTDGIFGKTDPFLKLYNYSEGIWCQVYKTEYIKECLDPIWYEFEISLQRLCNNDEKKKFKVECFDWHDKGKNNRLIGGFETTIDEIFNQNKNMFDIKMPKGGSGGKIVIESKQRVFRPNFNDFIKQGTTFNCIVGVDYSLYNGKPQFPDSLHKISEELSNPYSNAIKMCTQVVEKYNELKQIAMYGLGAEPHFENYYQKTYQSVFPLTGDFKQPMVQGSDEALKLYINTLPQIQFNGNLQLADFIEYLSTITKANQGKLKYSICFILTQGEISDIDNVVEKLIECSNIPLSIVFVGIGDMNDFNQLRELDNLVMQKSKIKRSMISVIDYKCHSKSPALLRKYLTSKIPSQVIYYYSHT